MSNDADDARIFSVDNRFTKLARRPGGPSRDQAIERAQTTLDDNKLGFGDWLDEELRQLGDAIERCASQDTRDSEAADAARLHCRHIRDVGTTMGYELASFVANNLCEIFASIKAGAEYRGDLVDCHFQALLLAKQEQYRNLRPEQLPELSSGLRRVAEYMPVASWPPST
jgi:hypothetical protein